MPQCSSCKGIGATLPLRAGICGHCERKGCATTILSVGAATSGAERITSSSASFFSASAVTIDQISGQKRARTAETLSADEIRAIIEAGADEVVPALDSVGVKRMLLTLERAVTKNSSLRARHADDALKFLDSEVEVDRALKALQALAAAPDQYAVLIESETLRATLPGLLAHENVDIAIDVIELLKELLDDDVAGASPEAGRAANALLDAVASADLLQAAMENLTRLSVVTGDDNTQQDTSGILACFELVETILTLQPARASDLCKPASSKNTPAPLLTALFNRVCSKIFDDVKSLAADLLATLVSADPNVVALIGEGSFQKGTADGIECLLEAIAVYKRRAPNGADETETVGNLFDVICTCLLLPANRPRFLAAEGFELMTRIIGEAGFARLSALKALSFAVAGRAEAEAFVIAGGLKCLFPSLLGLGLPSTRTFHGAAAVRSEDEFAVATLAALLEFLPQAPIGVSPAPKAGLERLRLLSKFLETGGEKVERLVDLQIDYGRAVAEAHEKDEETDDENDEEDEEDGDEAEEQKRHARFTLSRVNYCLKTLCMEGKEGGGDVASLSVSRAVAESVKARLTELGVSLPPPL